MSPCRSGGRQGDRLAGVDSLLTRLDWSRLEDPALRRRALHLASAVFLLGSGWALARRPDLFGQLHLAPVLVQISVAVPAAIVLNATEYMLSARLLDLRVRARPALEVTLLGSAANLLPIPGAFLVRVAHLRGGGVPIRRGTLLSLLLGLAWAATAFGWAGIWLALLSKHALAAIFLCVAVAGLVATGSLALSLKGPRLLGWLLLNKVALVLLESFRILLSFWILGAPGGYGHASVLVVGSVLGSAVSVIPGGLGVRELTSAALAPSIGLEAPDGFLVAAVNRLLEVAVLVPLALVLARRPRPRPGEEFR